MPYSKGPYSLFPVLPSPERPVLSSSREIDFTGGDYVTDSVGGFESMSSTAQRVVLLVAYAGGTPSKFITPQDMAAQEDRVKKALASMTSGKTPAIELKSVTSVRTAAGRTLLQVDFKDLTTGVDESVQL